MTYQDDFAALGARLDLDLTALADEVISLRADVDALIAAGGNPPPGWVVVLDEQWNGSTVDTAQWFVRNDSQGNHYGKNEVANAQVHDGVLDLVCSRRDEPWIDKNGRVLPYSTAYLDNKGKPSGSQVHGRWGVECPLPQAKGAWPAFWLRDNVLGGEIDVVEAVVRGEDTGGWLVFTVHQDTNGGGAKRGHEWQIPSWFSWDDVHRFEVEWDGDTMTWTVDGQVATHVTVAELPWLATSFSDDGLNIRLNYQAGGAMPEWYETPMDDTSDLPDLFTVHRVWVLGYAD